MDDFWKTLLSVGGGFVAGNMSYLYQYRRNRKVEHKSKIRIAVRILHDCIDDLKESHGRYAKLLSALAANIYEFPDWTNNIHPSVGMMVATVQDEHFQNACASILREAIDAEEYLVRLRKHAWLAKISVENIGMTCSKAEQKSGDNNDAIIECVKTVIRKQRAYGQSGSPDPRVVDRLQQVVDDYKTSGDHEDYVDLNELKLTLIDSILEYWETLPSVPTDTLLIELYEAVTNISFLLRQNEVNHQILIEQVEGMNEQLSMSVSDLSAVLAFLDNRQIKNLSL